MGTTWTVYIVRCKNKTLYTGITNDLSKRIATHNAKKGGGYTRAFGPVKLVWSEPQETRSSALRREAAIKKLSRSMKLALIRN